MTLPVEIVYDRTAQELEDYIVGFMKGRNINPAIMEMMLYKVLSGIQKRKEYDYANLFIAQEELNQQKKEEKEEVK